MNFFVVYYLQLSQYVSMFFYIIYSTEVSEFFISFFISIYSLKRLEANAETETQPLIIDDSIIKFSA